jgi:hypothetical protein
MNEINTKFRVGGKFEVECWRVPSNPLTGEKMRYPNGRLAPAQLVWIDSFHNIVTNEGLDHILDVVLHDATQVSTWYCSMFESDSTPAAGWTYDTYADSDCTEFTAYDEANRPEYNEAAASSQSTTNSANKAQFTVNDTKTLYGAALVSVNTKSDHGAGTLLCAGTFASSRSVVDDDVVNLTYTVGAADDGA